MTIRSVRLFGDYLGKTRGGNSLHFRLLLPTPLSPVLMSLFIVAAGRPTVQYGGLDGRVHFSNGEFSSGLITRFDGRATISVEIRRSVQWA